MAYSVGLIGLGTVGSGSAKTLLGNAETIATRAGVPVCLAAVADLDLETDRGFDLSSLKTTTDAWELIRDPDLGCIIELVGGETIAFDFVKGALENGKDVVTANKALLASRGAELFRIAEENNQRIHFEGAVGGGIPLIQSFYGGLASAQIRELHSIINGTCNYILTSMEQEGRPFHVVLKEAQELGYAELDPTFDVEGVDAAHKVALMASICFGTQVNLKEIHCEGIRNITVEDIRFGEKLGYRLKLLAIAKDLGDQIEVRVHPTFIPKGQLLASVNGVFNAVSAYAEGLGSTLLYGRGAGDLPTGHAVISDVIQCAHDSIARRPVNYANFYTPTKPVMPIRDVVTKYYLRLLVNDQPRVLSSISSILGDHDISLLSVLQTETAVDGKCPVVIMTHEAREGDLNHALEHIQKLEEVIDPVKMIRIEAMDRPD